MNDNGLLAELRREREARAPPPEPKKAKAEPPEVIDLDDDDDEADMCMRGSSPRNGAAVAPWHDADAALAARLQQEENEAAHQGDAALAAKLSSTFQEYGASSSRAADGDAPWPDEVTFYEMQHMPKNCGNFDVCSNGSSFFFGESSHYGVPYIEHTAHALEPRPMPGQTFTIKYLPHTGLEAQRDLGPELAAEAALGLRKGATLLSDGGERKHRPGIDGTSKTVKARTPSFTPFSMPPFRGSLEEVPLGPFGEKAYLLRNFDGANGARLAERLEGCFGLDIVDPPSGKGTSAKCAAAQGNNCQDSYTKLYPLRMFLEHRMELLAPMLHAMLATVNRHAPPNTPELRASRGDSGAPSVGEAQMLRFLSGGSGGGSGSKMHVHVDKPGTRWVSIMAVGDSSTFLLDYAPRCKRCWTGGGKGTRDSSWKEWHKLPCATCHEVTLASGDCLLFFGEPTAGVAHGTIATHRNSAPPGLPSWCYGGRVSCQYRQTEKMQNYAECGAYD